MSESITSQIRLLFSQLCLNKYVGRKNKKLIFGTSLIATTATITTVAQSCQNNEAGNEMLVSDSINDLYNYQTSSTNINSSRIIEGIRLYLMDTNANLMIIDSISFIQDTVEVVYNPENGGSYSATINSLLTLTGNNLEETSPSEYSGTNVVINGITVASNEIGEPSLNPYSITNLEIVN